MKKKQRPPRGPGSNDREPAPQVRFEATVHAGRKPMRADWRNQLEIDRVQDPKGEVRALLTAEDCVRLLDEGFEVRLQHAHPVRPLDPKLIETDESVRRRVEEQLKGIARATGPRKSPGEGGA